MKNTYRQIFLISAVIVGTLLLGMSYLNPFEQQTEAAQEFETASWEARQSGVIISNNQGGAPPPIPITISDRIKVFVAENNIREFYGFAPGQSEGILAARFNPFEVSLTTDSKGTRINGDKGWYVIIYYLDTNAQGEGVYQVNVYNSGGVLQDDNFVFLRK